MAGRDMRNVRQRKKPDQHSNSKSNSSKNNPPEIDKLSIFLFIAVPTIITVLIGYYYYQDMLRKLISTPSSAPPIITEERALDMGRFWGTYRPGVYFGTKTRSPNSPVTGMMWFEQRLPQQPQIRHRCEQGDRLPQYGWTQHNGVDFGVHDVRDDGYSIVTEFVKRNGGRHGGDWSAKIKARTQTGTPLKKISLLYYLATNGATDIEPEMEGEGHLTALRGYDSELGRFRLSFRMLGNDVMLDNMVTYTPGYENIEQVVKYGLEVRQLGSGAYLGLKGRLVPQDTPGPNMYVFQVTALLPLTLEVIFESESFADRPSPLEGVVLSEEVNRRSKAFHDLFEAKFGLSEKGFDKQQIRFAEAALSNMIGGIGYFHGASKVQSKYNDAPIDYWPASLFTAVPSRSFFPRGFLWDEGFHNLLIKEWDEDLSMEVIGYWMDLMNTEGWIPREQILGGEARAKVPDEFVVQNNENANPPTFFLPLESIVHNLIEKNDTRSTVYLERIYPRLKIWYNWFNKTQTGKLPYTYRWKGRNPNARREINPKTLTSGLDDYPRASHPTEEERHLDLRCWMALASKVMAEIAKKLDEPWQSYQETYDKLSDNQLLNQLHWSDQSKRYADFGLHTDATKLKRPPPPKNVRPGTPVPKQDKERVVTKEPALGLVTSFMGYVSLFPLLTQIIEPESEQLGHTLKSMRDQNQLWTNYGLRSLSKSSPMYQRHNTEHDPPYWRGAIWININYLAVRSLHHYSHASKRYGEEARQLYKELRSNIMENIYRQYRNTGYIWEQYDDITGNGKGCHPFTGWSALVTLIMAEKY